MPRKTKTKRHTEKHTAKKKTAKRTVKKGRAVQQYPRYEQSAHNAVLVSWVAPEYAKHHRGIVWYVLAALSLGGIMWYSLASGSWTTGAVFLLLAGVYLMNMRDEPRRIVGAVTELGIQYGTQFYPFSQIQGFWVVYKPPRVSTLHLKLVNKREDISIELGEQSPVVIRNLLSREIPEVEGEGEPFINYVTRILKL